MTSYLTVTPPPPSPYSSLNRLLAGRVIHKTRCNFGGAALQQCAVWAYCLLAYVVCIRARTHTSLARWWINNVVSYRIGKLQLSPQQKQTPWWPPTWKTPTPSAMFVRYLRVCAQTHYKLYRFACVEIILARQEEPEAKNCALEKNCLIVGLA